MPPDVEFQHLPLPFVLSDRAFLTGGGNQPEQFVNNKANRIQHGTTLATAARTVVGHWDERRRLRTGQELPPLPAGVPILLKIEPDSDLDFLRSTFGFEIVSEQEDGFVIVASDQLDLAAFVEKVEAFSRNEGRTGNSAKIYEIMEDQTLESRLDRLLSEMLRLQWPQIDDRAQYVVEFGIECVGTIVMPELKPQSGDESDEDYEVRLRRWELKKHEAYEKWDELRLEREDHFVEMVRAYDGEVLDLIDGEAVFLPDSFTVRARISGLGLKDVVLNYPYLFEVSEPDVLYQEESMQAEPSPLPAFEILPPDETAPYVCVIDSGIQEEHSLIRDAIDTTSSECFIPGKAPIDVADYVSNGGHGTRVAGVILYPEGIPRDGSYQLPFWIRNARVLDEDNRLVEEIFPPTMLSKVVTRHSGNQHPHPTKIFNHSISGFYPCRLRHMSAWAAQIDLLSYEKDILLVQSAGNLCNTHPGPIRYGITDHLRVGRKYPQYLLEDSCRIPNPSQSFQALTVGSVAHAEVDTLDSSSFETPGMPSAFTTTGLGIWGSIKPEVVEYGGGTVYDRGNPPNITTPPEVCPELVRSTYPHGGPAFARDSVGTSFSAPKVAHIAASIEAIFPDEPALLYRALIVNSARWPSWAEDHGMKSNVIKKIGYGIPDLERATSNSSYRVTLITSGEMHIRAREAHIYRVPIPDDLRNIVEDHDLRVDVTLSYAAKPRRTRRHPRNYLSTWVDWKSSKTGESYDSFKNRVLKDGVRGVNDGGEEIPWMLRERNDWGNIEGIKRGIGTVQKDWAVLKSNQFPEDFCIGVVGHQGWDKDIESFAKYSLAVTFESVNEDLEIYDRIQAAIENMVEVGEIQVEI
ncbi:S8 family peptidase [Geomonas edaphica]|uniref:S8 family peptidase n=1 Tax=Geomonas edaphica TaxID=2570226 RepID=UPI0010A7EBB4|nr:S8 family peptidase [Geomonas edaphica]